MIDRHACAITNMPHAKRLATWVVSRIALRDDCTQTMTPAVGLRFCVAPMLLLIVASAIPCGCSSVAGPPTAVMAWSYDSVGGSPVAQAQMTVSFVPPASTVQLRFVVEAVCNTTFAGEAVKATGQALWTDYRQQQAQLAAQAQTATPWPTPSGTIHTMTTCSSSPAYLPSVPTGAQCVLWVTPERVSDARRGESSSPIRHDVGAPGQPQPLDKDARVAMADNSSISVWWRASQAVHRGTSVAPTATNFTVVLLTGSYLGDTMRLDEATATVAAYRRARADNVTSVLHFSHLSHSTPYWAAVFATNPNGPSQPLLSLQPAILGSNGIVFIVKDTTWTSSDTDNVFDRITILQSSTLTVQGTVLHVGSLVIQSGASLQLPASAVVIAQRVRLHQSGKILGNFVTLIVSDDLVVNGTLAAIASSSLSSSKGSSNDCGGSYGGVGRCYYSRDSPGQPYGCVQQPASPGSFGSSRSGAGGGVLRVDVGGTLFVNATGSITANGERRYYGGSGGSVWITAARLVGSGAVRAAGGTSSSSPTRVGGGGRVAVHVSDDDMSSWRGYIGAPAGSPDYGGTGTVFVGVPAQRFVAVAGSTYEGLVLDTHIVYSLVALEAGSTVTGATSEALVVNATRLELNGTVSGAWASATLVSEVMAFGPTAKWDTSVHMKAHVDRCSVGGGASLLWGKVEWFVSGEWWMGRASDVAVSGDGTWSVVGDMMLGEASTLAVARDGSWSVMGDMALGADSSLTVSRDGSWSVVGDMALGVDSSLTVSRDGSWSVMGDMVLGADSSLTVSQDSVWFVVGDMVLGEGSGLETAKDAQLNVTGSLSVESRAEWSAGVQGVWYVRGNLHTRVDADVRAPNMTLYVGGNVSMTGTLAAIASSSLSSSKGSVYRSSCGGSYGGAGGCYYSGDSPGQPYGCVQQPTSPGSFGSSRSGAGGGVLRVDVGGTLFVNATGSITANGERQYYGGSGGSVWITAARLVGSGAVRAAGGTSSSSPTRVGGGGRVAVHVSDDDMSSWRGYIGAPAGSPDYGGTGTVFVGVRSTRTFEAAAGSTYEGLVLAEDEVHALVALQFGSTVKGATETKFYVQSSKLEMKGEVWATWTSVTLMAEAFVLHDEAVWLRGSPSVNISGYDLQVMGTMHVVSASFAAQGNLLLSGSIAAVSTASTVSTAGSPQTGCGASHGGMGKCSSGDAVTPPYGSLKRPTMFGSRSANGGLGGGVVRVVVDGALTVTPTGSITADAVSGSWAGSGGSVWVTAGKLSGSGAFSARGGSGYSAGGRIAIHTSDGMKGWTGSIVAAGGGSSPLDETAGTVYIDAGIGFEAQPGSLYTGLVLPTDRQLHTVVFRAESTIRGAAAVSTGFRANVLTLNSTVAGIWRELWLEGGQLIFGSKVVWPVTFDMNVSTSSCFVAPGARLMVDTIQWNVTGGVDVAGALQVNTAQWSVGDFHVRRGGEVTVTYLGEWHVRDLIDLAEGSIVHVTSGTWIIEGSAFIGGTISAMATDATVSDQGTSTTCGGSFGSQGYCYTGVAAPVYGNLVQPVSYGSRGYGSSGGLGGGVIRLVVAKKLVVNATGRITANGQTREAAAGSGGSVWITASQLVGHGVIQAGGGDVTGTAVTSGGGGRVAVYTTMGATAWHGIISAAGGRSFQQPVPPAASGTVFLQLGSPKTELVFELASCSAPSTLSSRPFVDTLTLRNRSCLVLNQAYSVGAVAVQTVESTSLVVNTAAGLVLWGDVCNGSTLQSNITGLEPQPLVMQLDPNQPRAMNLASNPHVTFRMSFVPADAVLVCRYEQPSGAPLDSSVVLMAVEATDDCRAHNVATCVVPRPDVDVTGSSIMQVRLHDTARDATLPHPHVSIALVTDVQCNLLTNSTELPQGCTRDMLADDVCDAACNTRNCAYDARSCVVGLLASVFVAPNGSDVNPGTEELPVATLRRAAHIACTGYTHCWPIIMQPGNYSCPASTLHVTGHNISIGAAATAANTTVQLARCDDGLSSAPLSFTSATVTLSDLYLAGDLLLNASDAYVSNSTLANAMLVADSHLSLTAVTMAPSTVSVATTPGLEPWLAERRAVNAWCPACAWFRTGQPASAIAINGLRPDGGGTSTMSRVVQGETESVDATLIQLSLAALTRPVLVLRRYDPGLATTPNFDIELHHFAVHRVRLSSSSVSLAATCALRPVSAGACVSFAVGHGTAPALALAGVDFDASLIHVSSPWVLRLSGKLEPDDAVQQTAADNVTPLTQPTLAIDNANATLVTLEGLHVAVAHVDSTALVLSSTRSNAIEVALVDCRITGPGAGILALAQTHITMQRCVMEECSTSGSGAAMKVTGGASAILHDVVMRANTATFHGGAVYVSDDFSSVRAEDCHFIDNQALGGGGGGAVVTARAELRVSRTVWQSNQGAAGGGAISVTAASLATVTDSHFESNADATGGALFVSGVDSVITARQCTAVSQLAYTGGMVHATEGGVALLTAMQIEKSHAQLGGTLSVDDGGRIHATACTIKGSSAVSTGAAVLCEAGRVELVGTRITSCSGGRDGAIVFAGTGAQVTLEDTVVANNTVAGAALLVTSTGQLSLAQGTRVESNRPSTEVGASTSTAWWLTPAVRCSQGGSLIAPVNESVVVAGNVPFNLACDACALAPGSIFSASACRTDGGNAKLVAAGNQDLPLLATNGTTVVTAAVTASGVAPSAEGWPSVLAYVGPELVAASLQGSDATELVAVVQTPEGAGTDIPLTLFLDGAAMPTPPPNPTTVSYLPPTLRSAVPRVVAPRSSRINITGWNFGPDEPGWRSGDRVDISGTPCSSPWRASSTMISCLPEVGPGSGQPVTVNIGGQSQAGPVLTIDVANKPASPAIVSADAVVTSGSTSKAPNGLRVAWVDADGSGIAIETFTAHMWLLSANWTAWTQAAVEAWMDSHPSAATVQTDGTTQEATFSGLATGYMAAVAVDAANAVGRSPLSAPQTVLLVLPPAPPTGTVATHVNSTTLQLSFTPGQSRGGTTAAFIVDISSDQLFVAQLLPHVVWVPGSRNGTDDLCPALRQVLAVASVKMEGGWDGGATDRFWALVPDLEPHKVYWMRVRGVNCGGQGQNSNTYTASELITPPSAATHVTTKLVASAQAGLQPSLHVTFQAPATDGGAPLSSFQLQGTSSAVSGGVHAPPQPVQFATVPATSAARVGGAITVEVVPVLVGHAYTVQVAAANVFRPGVYGTWSNASTPLLVAAPPAPPSAQFVRVKGVTGGSANMEVVWSTPVDNGGAISQYRVVLVSTATAQSWKFVENVTIAQPTGSIVTAHLPLVLPAGGYNRRFTVTLHAHNQRGWSADGIALTASLPCAAGYGTWPAGSTPSDVATPRCLRCQAGEFGSGNPAGDLSGLTTAELNSQSPCTPCPVTKYSPTAGSSACQACPTGAAPTASGDACQQCEPGEYFDNATLLCVPCPPGTQGDPNSAMSCLTCPAGRVAAKAGTVQCVTCGPGERAIGGTACELCPDSTFATDGGVGCEQCPSSGVDCSQGILVIKEGYWYDATATDGGIGSNDLASITSTTQFFKCPPGACLLPQDSQHNGTLALSGIECATGHTGVMCGVCKPGFALVNGGCESCDNSDLNALLLGVTLLLVAATIGLSVFRGVKTAIAAASQASPSPSTSPSPASSPSSVSSLSSSSSPALRLGASSPPSKLHVMNWNGSRAATKLGVARSPSARKKVARFSSLSSSARGGGGDKDLLVPIVKIAFSWLQVLSFMRDFTIPWPSALAGIWSGAGAGSSMPVDSRFMSCTVGLAFYSRLLLAALSPLILVVIIVAVVAAVGQVVRLPPQASDGGQLVPRQRDPKRLVRKAAPTAVMMMWFVAYPTVIREMVRVMACTPPVSGVHYLRYDLSLRCGTGMHVGFTVLAVIVLLVFALGLPVGTVVALIMLRRRGSGKQHKGRALAFLSSE